jgi:hypothetical protein
MNSSIRKIFFKRAAIPDQKHLRPWKAAKERDHKRWQIDINPRLRKNCAYQECLVDRLTGPDANATDAERPVRINGLRCVRL